MPNHTPYPDARSYYQAYALTGDTLAKLQIPSQLILSLDDPMIPCDDLQQVARPDALTIETTTYGGHCGFLMNWKLDSWIDQRLLQLFRPV